MVARAWPSLKTECARKQMYLAYDARVMVAVGDRLLCTSKVSICVRVSVRVTRLLI